MAYRETERVRARKAAQNEHLISCAEQLVRSGGFAALTMQTLANEADVGVGTLYRYFDNKADLATQVFRLATEREVAAMAAAAADGADAPQRLGHAVHQFVRRAQAAPRLAHALIAEPVDPAVEAERLHYRQAYARLYRRILDEGVRRGELPPQSTSVTAAAIVGGIAEALVGPLAAPLMDAALADELIAFVLRAVGSADATCSQ